MGTQGMDTEDLNIFNEIEDYMNLQQENFFEDNQYLTIQEEVEDDQDREIDDFHNKTHTNIDMS